MSIKRFIGCLLVKQGIVVQSIGFEKYLPVGKPEIAARFFDEWGVDETVLLDIDASKENRVIDPDLVKKVSRAGFAPVTAGGGIRDTEDIRVLLEAGVDKICINQLASRDLAMVEEASRLFGAQCIVGSVDVRRTESGAYSVYTDSGSRDCGADPVSYAKGLVDAGVGEIFLTSIDKDGSRAGYDMELIKMVAPELSVPVIVCGGAGNPAHLEEALKLDSVSAVAAANFLHHSEQSISVMKSWLRNADADVRGEYHAMYRKFPFDEAGRVAKLPDDELIEQSFEFIEDEPI